MRRSPHSRRSRGSARRRWQFWTARCGLTVKHLADGRRARNAPSLVFTSDNGYYLGEHLKRQGKINLHEPSIRVPLLMAGPRVPQGSRFDPVSGVDSRGLLLGGREQPLTELTDLTFATSSPTVTKAGRGRCRSRD